MFEFLNNIDAALFHFINGTLHNVALEFLCAALREKFIWVPVYLFGAFFLIMNYRSDGWKILGVLVLLVIISDQTTSTIMKPVIGRLRPCSVPDMHAKLPLFMECGAGFSMPSSHASNHVSIAIFIGLIFYKKYANLLAILCGWAASICFSQIYVGVHYPFDILVGALWGGLLGYWAYRLCKRFLSKQFYAPPLPAPPRRRRRSHRSIFEKSKTESPAEPE